MIDFVELPSGLLMTKTPITQAQWREVMGTDPSYFKGDDLPVECVSWHETMEFCQKTGTRLPTEDEWEYAYGAWMASNIWEWCDHKKPYRVIRSGSWRRVASLVQAKGRIGIGFRVVKDVVE